MRGTRAAVAFGMAAALLAACAPRSPSASPAAARAALVAGIDSLGAAFDRAATCASARDGACTARAIRDARRAFKTHEALVERLAPFVAPWLNGRSLEHDDEAQPRTRPSAFAALDAAASDDWDAIVAAARDGRASTDTLRLLARAFDVTPDVAFDAARLEIARVATLGVTGYDTPTSREGARESAIALRGTATMLRASAAPSAALDVVVDRLHAAAGWLDAHADFATLDRLAYYVAYSEPALRALDAAREAAGVPRAPRRVWVGVGLFDRGAIDPQAYAPFYAPPPTRAIVALGARLFAEPALAGAHGQPCVACHDPSRAFADGRAEARSLHPGARRLRNTPSLRSAGTEAALFADARAASLESQAAMVLASRDEMGSSDAEAAARLGRLPAYRAAFAAAFGAARDSDVVTAPRVLAALAAYVRSLASQDSRVNRALRGDTLALSPDERRGLTLFLGKAQCGTCHFAPLFSGATPPLYRSVDAEVIGVPALGAPHRLDDDPGRGAIDHLPAHAHAFKTPSLRGVSRTAPYMHDGAFATLEQVIDFYDKGGGAGLGLAVPNQTLPPKPLQLTADEKRLLVAFLRALE